MNGVNWERLRELDEANPREHVGEHVCVDGRRYASDCWVLAWHRGEHRLRGEYEARLRAVATAGAMAVTGPTVTRAPMPDMMRRG